jgi:electron transfer flavoprotein beta subunit
VKILVPLKQVSDPDHSARIVISADGTAISTKHLEAKTNPFDEYALEAALRLAEDGREPRKRLGEVITVTIGGKSTETMLRSSLATGADRAICVEGDDGAIDGRITAKVLAAIVRKQDIDLVILGKQTVDGDGNEVAQRLAAILDWPQATSAGEIFEQENGRLVVEREVDGGVTRLQLTLPAVISVDLRIVAARSVRSRHTPETHVYPAGVRFASLPAIMQSKRKPLEVVSLESLIGIVAPVIHYSHYRSAQTRAPGRILGSCEQLVELLTNEAKVI